MPFEQKVAAQAAKLGKPFVEAGKGVKALGALSDLAGRITAITDSGERDDLPAKGKANGKAAAKGGSLFAKLGGMGARKKGK